MSSANLILGGIPELQRGPQEAKVEPGSGYIFLKFESLTWFAMTDE